MKDPRTYAIIGCAMDVHRSLGPGLHERDYQEALAMEFEAKGIPFRREAPLQVVHRGKVLSHPRFADFIGFDSIVVEAKVASAFTSEHFAQALAYMRSARIATGLLLNFGRASLDFRRLIVHLGPCEPAAEQPTREFVELLRPGDSARAGVGKVFQ